MKMLYSKNKTLTQIVKEQCWIARSYEGQCLTTCWWKGLDLSNIVQVNPLTNDKVITEIQNFNATW